MTVTEYGPCRYSISYCVLSKDAMGTSFNHIVLVEERLNLYNLKHSMLKGSITMIPRLKWTRLKVTPGLDNRSITSCVFTPLDETYK